MNTTDYTPTVSDWADAVRLQEGLMEKMEGLRPGTVDIDTAAGQEQFKRLAWRIIEEAAETLDAWEKWRNCPDEGRLPLLKAHIDEEAADTLNFFVELCLAAGDAGTALETDPQKGINAGMEGLPVTVHAFTKRLAMAANFLKNRAWRKTQHLTDSVPFWETFRTLAPAIGSVIRSLGYETKEDMSRLWSLKYQVNMFRLESNY